MIPNEFIAAVVNHLWQSTAVVGVAWLLTVALRKNHARVRYWMWMAASVKFLLPFSLLIAAGEWVRSLLPATAVTQPGVANAMEQVAQPFAAGEMLGPMPSRVHTHPSVWFGATLLAIWVSGALLVFARFARGWWRVYVAKRYARPVDLAVGVPVLASPAQLEPGIFGIVRPVLLMPEGIFRKLTAEQLQAIVVHEMAHVRRLDNLTFALHMFVEALFWFYPPVWWIGARLIEEREMACDDVVVRGGGAAQTYAEGILNVCKFYVESPVECVAGVTGADLKKRIARIMTGRTGLRMSRGRRLLIAASALIALSVPLVLGWGQVQAGKVMLIHPQNGTRPSFEVATIKPTQDSTSRSQVMLSPAHFAVRDMSVHDMMMFAYGIKSDDQIVDAPNWLKTEHFDIQAKASDADIAAFDKLAMEEKMTMPRLLLQSLIEDRFQMKATMEIRDLPAYALVVASGGIKMKEAKPDPLPPPGTAPPPGAHLTMFRRTGPNEFTATAWRMPQFAEQLSHFYDVGNRPVLDETGLSGFYDFVLSGVSITAPAAGDANGSGAQAPDVSLFSALPEQLGLKLLPVKAPTEVLVIKSIEQPTAN